MSAPELIDTHAHLDDAILGADLSGLLARARQAGVTTVLTIGTTAASSAAAVAMAGQWPQVFAAVGIQPNHGAQATAADWDCIVRLAEDAGVRAIGETGLDAHWDYTPMELQRRLFAQHLRLSQQRNLPVVVHMRDCGLAVVEALRSAHAEGPLRGVMHSFTGDLVIADACLELGLHISFAGMVTFKNAHAVRQVARHVPTDRILIETDSPYLTPHPCRKQRPNEPAMLQHTARCLAEIRGVAWEQLAAQTTANARALFDFD